MKKNFSSLVLVVLFGALWASAEAQQSEKIPRVVYLTSFGAPSVRQFDAFRQGLKEFGYAEGKTIILEYRYPKDKPEGTPAIVAEVMQNKVDIFVAADTTAIRALKKATKIIPVVMLSNQNPVAAGLVDSLAHPGGNVTGVTRLARELGGKRLELLKEMVPKISRVAVLRDIDPPATAIGFKKSTRLRCAR
jgi:putative ABC transport system substrate-binding protein